MLHSASPFASPDNLRRVVRLLADSDPGVRQQALGAAFCLLRANPALAAPATPAQPLLERALLGEPGFARTLCDNAGRLPLLILIILVLGIFSIGGFLLQGVAHAVGTAIPVSIAALATAAISIPVIRTTSRGLARMIPRDESYAVDDNDFVGKVATVAVGPLDQGLPGRVRLKDVFGNWHTVSARASHDSPELAVGASVLLVDRDAKGFVAITAPADLIQQQSSSRA